MGDSDKFSLMALLLASLMVLEGQLFVRELNSATLKGIFSF